MMPEPANHTAWIDPAGDTWIRVDDTPHGPYCNWWPLTDGPGWHAGNRDGLGTPRPWYEARRCGPFTLADRARTALALARVRQEAGR